MPPAGESIHKQDRFLAKTFLPDGKPIRFGDIFKNPDLARVYEILGRDGAAAFYQGEIAERIVKFSQAVGGQFSLRDFRDHKANWVEPVSSSYRGYDVWEIPPNGQGIATLQILNMLETFDIGVAQAELRRTPAPVHRGQEAGLRGSGRLLRRHGFRQGAARRNSSRRITPASGPS